MSTANLPQGWRRRPAFKLGHLLLAIALISMMLGLVRQHRANVGLRQRLVKHNESRRQVVRGVRYELISTLQSLQGFNIHFDRQEEDYIEAEKRVRHKLGALLADLPDKEGLMRQMKHEHDTGAWAPTRIRGTVKND